MLLSAFLTYCTFGTTYYYDTKHYQLFFYFLKYLQYYRTVPGYAVCSCYFFMIWLADGSMYDTAAGNDFS